MRLHRLIRACTQVSPQENLQQLQVTMPRKTFFYTEGSMIDNVAGFAVHNRNYETGHQLAKPSSVFLAEISGAYSNFPSWSIFDFVRQFEVAYGDAVKKDYM
jgi:hypothetical protein